MIKTIRPRLSPDVTFTIMKKIAYEYKKSPPAQLADGDFMNILRLEFIQLVFPQRQEPLQQEFLRQVLQLREQHSCHRDASGVCGLSSLHHCP